MGSLHGAISRAYPCCFRVYPPCVRPTVGVSPTVCAPQRVYPTVRIPHGVARHGAEQQCNREQTANSRPVSVCVCVCVRVPRRLFDAPCPPCGPKAPSVVVLYTGRHSCSSVCCGSLHRSAQLFLAWEGTTSPADQLCATRRVCVARPSPVSDCWCHWWAGLALITCPDPVLAFDVGVQGSTTHHGSACAHTACIRIHFSRQQCPRYNYY